MITLYQGEAITRFEGPRKEVRILVDLMRKFDPQARFHPDFKAEIWDGMVNFLEPDGKSFLSGFLPYLTHFLGQKGVPFEIKGEWEPGPKAEIPDDFLEGITLRGYQVRAIRRAIHYRRGVLKIPPRGGKTACEVAVMKYLNRPSILLTHTQELLSQHLNEMKRWLPENEIGVFGAGKKTVRKFTVAMTQSLSRDLESPKVRKWIEGVEVLQADETHHLGSASSWQEVFRSSKASWRLGWSGTPYRTSGDGFDPSDFWLMGHTGRKLLDVPASQLIEEGHVSDATVYFVKSTTSSEKIPYHLRVEQGPWVYSKLYKACITGNENRNTTAVRILSALLKRGRKVLVMVNHVTHGHDLQKLFDMFEIPSLFLMGSRKFVLLENGSKTKGTDSKGERLAAITEDDSEIKTLVVSPAFDEGVTLTGFDAIILMGAGRSAIKSLQRIFRALTSKAGKKTVYAIDFQDETHFVFKHQSGARAKEYAKQGLRVAKRVPAWMEF